MTVAPADWHDILTVLHETYRIWSAGLSMSEYRRHLAAQMAHPWGRRHLRFIVQKENGNIVSSCKLYDLTAAARGKDYRILGIGAVYTMERFRGAGHAGNLIERVIAMAENEQYDGLMLYSEIGAEFYSEFGFDELGAADFDLSISDSAPQEVGENTRFPRTEDMDWMGAHHRRWLRRQPYGILRTRDYMHYKFCKEAFLHRHSSLSWPAQELLTVDIDRNNTGYMLIEQGGSTVRVLEVIGTEKARAELWRQVLSRSIEVGAKRLRGWESSLRDFAPGFSLDSFIPNSFAKNRFAPMQYSERDWGIPMLLPLNTEIDSWSNSFPCPLLELDHF